MRPVEPAVLRFITTKAWPPLSLCTRCKASIKTWMLAQHQLFRSVRVQGSSFKTFGADAAAVVRNLESRVEQLQGVHQ